MKYPYKVYRMKADDHIFWVAESETLQSCIGQGDTQEEAINELADNEQFWLETASEMGYTIPEIPTGTYETYSGKLTLRIAPHEHKLAAQNAKKEGISLNQFINDAVVAHNREMETEDYISETCKTLEGYFFRFTAMSTSTGYSPLRSNVVEVFNDLNQWKFNAIN